MEGVRAGIGAVRRSSAAMILRISNGSELGLGFGAKSKSFSQSATAPSTSLEVDHVSVRVLDLLKSFPFIDPDKISPVASLKTDLQLDILENVEVMMAVEDEFSLDIPENEANKISTTAQLIDYIATNPQSK